MNKEQLTALVVQAQKGDQDAFAQMYNASFQHVFYTARKILQDEHQAQDVAQEVFITVYQKLGELRDPAAYLGWVRQITAYKCSNLIQKKKEVLYSPVDEDEDSGLPDVMDDVDVQPDSVLEKASTKQIILDIIDQLPIERRAVVMMFYFQQLSVSEIAAATGKAEGTIKASLNAARKQIKLAVEKEEKESGVKLHSISALFLFRLFSEDAAAGFPASSIPQSTLDNVLAQGVAGQTATGTAAASQGATAGKAAAAKGLSFGAKIGLGTAGVAMVGSIVGFVALSMSGNSDPMSSLPMSQPITSSAPALVVTDDSTSATSEAEEPTIGLPLFGENDLAFLSKYLYPGQNGDDAAADLAAYLGTDPTINTDESSDSKRDERYFYWMDDTTYSYNDGMDLEGISYWLKWFPDFGPVNGRECDSFQLSLTMSGYTTLGFECGMSLSDAHAQAQVIMALDGIELVEFTDFATMDNLSDGFWLRFFYDGCEYLINVNCPRGETVVDGVVLSGKGADKDITDLGWIG